MRAEWVWCSLHDCYLYWQKHHTWININFRRYKQNVSYCIVTYGTTDGFQILYFGQVTSTMLVGNYCTWTLNLNGKDVPKIVRRQKLKRSELIAQHLAQCTGMSSNGSKKGMLPWFQHIMRTEDKEAKKTPIGLKTEQIKRENQY
jgi:hypothetical protein